MRVIREKDRLVFEGKDILSYQLKRMESRPWILPFQLEGESILYEKKEETDYGMSLKEWIASCPGEEELEALIRKLDDLEEQIELYFLDEENLWTDPEWIFWEKNEKMLRFVYLPFLRKGEEKIGFLERIACQMLEGAAREGWTETEAILKVFSFSQNCYRKNRETLNQRIESLWELEELESRILGEAESEEYIKIDRLIDELAGGPDLKDEPINSVNENLQSRKTFLPAVKKIEWPLFWEKKLSLSEYLLRLQFHLQRLYQQFRRNHLK